MYERCIGIEQFVTLPRFWLNLAFNLLPLHKPIFISILGIVHLSNPLWSSESLGNDGAVYYKCAEYFSH